MKNIFFITILFFLLFINCGGGSLLEGDVDLVLFYVIGISSSERSKCKQYLDGITVELVRDGEVVKQTRTEDGCYSFDGIGEGEYTVQASVYQKGAVVEGPDTIVFSRIEEFKTYPTLSFDISYAEDGSYIGANTVACELEKASAIKIVLYELNGERVEPLFEDSITAAGNYQIGLNICGKGAVNFATLEIEGHYKGLGFFCCYDSLKNL